MYRNLFFLILLVGVLYLVWGCSNQEDFKVLGNLASQRNMYYQCLSECERSDPALRLSPTKGSMMCQAYCDSTITDLARRGGPSYPQDIPVAPVEVTTRIDKAYATCGDGTKGNQCRKNFATDGEIDEKCRQDCAYSSAPTEECMKTCSNVLAVNKSTGWSWK
jgi:hypothetical protein